MAMRNMQLRFILIPWLFWSGFTPVRAADTPLTLDDAVDVATKIAPQLEAQRAAIDAAQAAVVSAGRLPDPEMVTGVDNLPIDTGERFSVTRDFMTMRKIGLMQNFPNSAKRGAQKDRAQAMVSVAQSEATLTQLELTQSVAKAWVTSYAAEVSLKRLEELKPGFALQTDLARAAAASGRTSAADALSAQATAADLDDRILDSRREVAAAHAELARWIGDAADRPLAAPPSFDELPVAKAALLGSLHHHAALLIYDARIEAAKRDIQLAHAGKRPDWSAELDYGQRGNGFSDMVSLQFRVSLPLFPGTRQDPVIEEKHAALMQLEADRETELKMHTAELGAMLASWESARDRIELYNRSRLPLAHQRTELALAALRAGRMDVRQTLITFTDEIEVERSYGELIKTLGEAWAYLRYWQLPGTAL